MSTPAIAGAVQEVARLRSELQDAQGQVRTLHGELTDEVRVLAQADAAEMERLVNEADAAFKRISDAWMRRQVELVEEVCRQLGLKP